MQNSAVRSQLRQEHITGAAYIFPDGEMIALEDIDAMQRRFEGQWSESPDKVRWALRGVALDLLDHEEYSVARAYLERVHSLGGSAMEEAEAVLRLGLILEGRDNLEAAAACYSWIMGQPETPGETWYFLHNNLGYCLANIWRYEEAEPHCRAAIAIDPRRHNAYKNLGLSFQGQGRFKDAAWCFYRAVVLCPGDDRAQAHLWKLVETQGGDVLEGINVGEEMSWN